MESIEVTLNLPLSEVHRIIGHSNTEVESLKAQLSWAKDLLGIRQDFIPTEWKLTIFERVIMSALLTHKGPVSRTHLTTILWPAKEPKCTEGILNVLIGRMRGKLQPFSILIKTIYGQGYYLDPPGKTIILQSIQHE